MVSFKYFSPKKFEIDNISDPDRFTFKGQVFYSGCSPYCTRGFVLQILDLVYCFYVCSGWRRSTLTGPWTWTWPSRPSGASRRSSNRSSQSSNFRYCTVRHRCGSGSGFGSETSLKIIIIIVIIQIFYFVFWIVETCQL
jgi:hypothetical protein